MHVNRGVIHLRNSITRQNINADFIEDIDLELIESTEAFWEIEDKRLRATALERGIAESDLPLDHSHWDWRKKIRAAQPGSRFFGVFCEERVQGLMKITSRIPCKLREQLGQSLVYIDYIEIAPWNIPLLAEQPQFRRIGSYFIEAAIEISRINGYEGRLGLHSLRKAEGFYESCGMTKCEMERVGYTLFQYSYFEMTPIQARHFVEGI